ncbi:excalibur calcium-binding domain-containing protein [Sphaerisporangium corydalis]|uniref:Excalibur calcium-binding domain-containing protein n=1 Tax=Sphaerisporangium corydalis TaxID=1441875 RepID=A0ABV9E7S1_9ACTN|nr:excalibur calcium-binding domain-containing protein [Sphaerisporangium corydalis]
MPESGPGEPPPGPGEPPDPGGPPAGPGGPGAPGGPPGRPGGPPRAARSTTIALIAGLFVVIVVTGVLGTIAVLMTREPGLPLGAKPPAHLATPIHFAPVTGVRPAPCPGAEAVLDDAGTTCYQVAPGVTVTSVVKVETVADKDGTYAVRVVLAPESRRRLADLTRDALNQLLAVVVDDKVVTAPRVAQAITEDSLSIAGLTKETADGLMNRLLGTGGAVTGTGTPTPGVTGPSPSAPQTGQPVTPPTTPATPISPAATGASPGAPSGSASQPGSVPLVPSGATHTPGAGGQTTPDAGASASPRTRATGVSTRSKRPPDPRFATCRQAHAAGYGPYTKGVHEEYSWYVDGDHDGVACERGDIT